MAFRTPVSDGDLQVTLAALIAAKGNQSAAGAALGRTAQNVHQHVKKLRAKGLLTDAMEAEWRARDSVVTGRRLPQTADECWALLDDYIGRSKCHDITVRNKRIRSDKRASDKYPPSSVKRIVIASDFHAPFHDPWAVGELITRESATADTLIINGDIQDFYSISRFVKHEQVSMEAELAATDALLGQLSAAFPEVILVSGNHDHARFEKQMRTMLSVEMCHVIEYLTGGNLSVLRVMAKRYPNVRFAETKVGRFGLGWLYQHGDLITTHAEKYSRVPGSALRGIDEWLTDFEDVIGVDQWRVLVQAHTHAGGLFPWKADRLLVECGCLCQTHGYQLTARIMGRPQRLGYVTLEQARGKTDINSVRFVWLDADRKAIA